MTLRFNVEGSPSLNDFQKARIREKLANRINKDGFLQIDSMRHRTQGANREDVLQRFITLIANAVTIQLVRKKTKIPRRVKEKRLQGKKLKSKLKAARTKKEWT